MKYNIEKLIWALVGIPTIGFCIYLSWEVALLMLLCWFIENILKERWNT